MEIVNEQWVRDWIATNHPRADQTLDQQVAWFLAMQLAEELREAFDTKDWAHLLLDGREPTKAEHLQDWLDEKHEFWAEDDTDPVEAMTDLLEEHFGGAAQRANRLLENQD